MAREPYGALYLHIPFCKKRCRYCDFTTNAVDANDPIIRTYVENMLLEIRHAGKDGRLSSCKTVYIGGGTPSYLGQKYLTEILYMLGLSMNLLPEMEVSMEANPDSLTEPMVRDLWALGVNRLSIGVQSFDDGVLQTLGRVHDAQAARNAIKAAQTRFENVSVDLMCGIPGQTMEGFLSDVSTAIDLGVKHVSVYPLTIERGTEMERLIKKGRLAQVDEDLQADMMQAAAQLLRSRGLERYEVASYAYPGFECRHNIAYWTGVPYLGIGHSAVSMAQDDLRLVRMQDGTVLEELNRAQMAAEDLMLGMRMSRGVSCRLVEQLADVLPEAPAAFDGLIARGLVERKDGRFVPTETGWLYGNELYGELLGLAP